MSKPILYAKNLYKYFGKIKAVDGVSFSVESGSCVGILGPNGAGKTTIIELLENINSADSGDIFYKNKPLDKNFHQHIGVQFQSTALQEFLKVSDHLKLFSSLYKTQKKLDEIIKVCNLKDFINQDARQLSGGQRQRLLLAIALVNDPDILFLDEPTTGLDPSARQSFWNLIDNVKKQGVTVILTTHYMEEAHQLCDNLLIMNHGKIIAEGHPKTLLRQHFNSTFLSLPIADLPKIPDDINGVVRQNKNFWEIRTDSVSDCLKQLLLLEIPLNRLTVSEPSLDDLFIKLTTKQQ